MALFGSGKQFAAMRSGRFQPPFGMPGAISGYGGGTFDMDGTQVTPAYSMPQDAALQDGANLALAAPEKKRLGYWQGGDKFTARDAIALALAAIGDGLSNQAGTPTAAVGNLIQSRMLPLKQAAALAAEQRERAADLADYRTRKGIDAEFEKPKGPEIGTFEDNVGNVWRFDKRTGQVVGDQPMFVDRSPRFTIQGNAAIRTPNPYDTPSAGGGAISEDDWNNASPMGGGGSNVTGGFR